MSAADINWGGRTKLIVTAAEILAAIGTDEDEGDAFNHIAVFADQYRPLRAQGLTYKQIGDLLSMTENMVKHRVTQARQAGLIETPAQVTAVDSHDVFIEQWREQHEVAA